MGDLIKGEWDLRTLVSTLGGEGQAGYKVDPNLRAYYVPAVGAGGVGTEYKIDPDSVS